MKRKFAWLGAILSGLYLVTAGPIPDPIPFIDEGVALAIFLKCTLYLGYDLRSWLRFLGKNKGSAMGKSSKSNGVTIDV
ncbi:MAG: hypothetical protein H7Y36_09175 [Armatimonadetes bacterium]|nr:hypothetical protein [Akkermansiaceae bacterium]